ncbi:hypothetical protein SAMN05216198_2275 [Halopseudomonas litoralis]|uniref:BrnT family toxin n=1 Tax=Halopseudomonas litoralis TaxID=797277 RepID=A0A1H1TD63_9GAMM|nr:BrnT family toxin [Halopseudomonas litoralis]SDS58222.1 hypothetical protein SAMN05216198_2275 [Halopseudomonas litoralis]
MNIEFDPAKNQRNIIERGLPFEEVADFEFESALFWIDDRKDYGEQRIRALGYIGKRLHALVFAETMTGIRIISFRKANRREIKHYESQT